MTPEKTKTGALMQALVKDQVSVTPAQRNAKAKKDLQESEAKLKAGGAKEKRFLALYRVRDPNSPAKGTSDERREHLIARFEGMNGQKHHVSTSAWSLRSYQATRELVLAALSPAIDPTLDYLEVVQTYEPVHAGVSKLKS